MSQNNIKLSLFYQLFICFLPLITLIGQNEDMFNQRILALIFVLISFNACQSSRLKGFDNLMLGQEKNTVLNLIGSPTYHERVKDQDRWTYIIYENDIRHEKVIYFLDGIVSYQGLPISPIFSAEEQDQINSEKNLHLANTEQKESSEKSK
jgi:outer membrane protein assembly factor BamE